MIDYQIQPNTRRCFLTNRELRPGEKFYSVLLDENGQLVRHDYSVEAWQGPPDGAFSFWAGKVPAPDQSKRPRIDDEMLFECFNRLEGQTDTGRINFRYVVALLLMRRKRLKFAGAVTEDGREVLHLRDARSGAEYEVVNPGLTDDEMASVQEEVLNVLGWE
jgi:hypothetical protein